MLRTIVFSGFFLVCSSLKAQSLDTLRLFVADQTLYAGYSYSFPVYSTNFDSIYGFQYTLSLSQEYVDSASLYSDHLTNFIQNFNWRKDFNQLGLEWSSGGYAKSIPKDTSLFNIYLKIKKDVSVRDLIKILYKGFVPPECINTINLFNGATMGISLNYNTGVSALVLASDEVDVPISAINLSPNPCKAGSLIQLKQDENIKTYQWFNLEGKVISNKQTLNNNQFIIPSQFSNGSYFIRFYKSSNKFSRARIEIVN